MVLGNVERFEIVVRRFDFRAFDDREANREENVFDFLKNLANEVMRTDRADDTGKREVNAVFRARGCFGSGFDGSAARFDLRIDMSAQFVQGSADGAFEFGRRRLQPIVGNQTEHTGFATEPLVAELLPFGFIVNGCKLPIELGAQPSEARGNLAGFRDAKSGKRFVETVRRWHR